MARPVSREHSGDGQRRALITNRSQPQECGVFGIDIGKNLFHIVALDCSGAIVQRVKFRERPDTLTQTAIART